MTRKLQRTDSDSINNETLKSEDIQDGTIMNVDIKSNAGIDASKLADGSVNNEAFKALAGSSYSIQSQFEYLCFMSLRGIRRLI